MNLIGKIICFVTGKHKRENACGNLPGDAPTVRRMRCPRCNATWTRPAKKTV